MGRECRVLTDVIGRRGGASVVVHAVDMYPIFILFCRSRRERSHAYIWDNSPSCPTCLSHGIHSATARMSPLCNCVEWMYLKVDFLWIRDPTRTIQSFWVHLCVPLITSIYNPRQSDSASTRMQLDNSAKKKVGPVNHQDFKAVIPVGYGEKSVRPIIVKISYALQADLLAYIHWTKGRMWSRKHYCQLGMSQ
jgi:hypothetical protein